MGEILLGFLLRLSNIFRESPIAVRLGRELFRRLVEFNWLDVDPEAVDDFPDYDELVERIGVDIGTYVIEGGWNIIEGHSKPEFFGVDTCVFLIYG